MTEFILDDNSVWTSHKLADKLKCSHSCANQRLQAHSDPALVFRKIGTPKTGKAYKKKEYALTKDSVVVFTGTAREIGLKWGVIQSTVYHRLRKGDRSIEIITKPANNSKATNIKRARPLKPIAEAIKERSFWNPLDKLWMGLKPAQ